MTSFVVSFKSTVSRMMETTETLAHLLVSLSKAFRDDPYKPPRIKTNMRAIFLGRVTCSRHIYGNGITNRAMSVIMFGTAIPMKKLWMLMHRPKTKGFHMAWIGTQVKMATTS